MYILKPTVTKKYTPEISTLGVLARVTSIVAEESRPGRTAFLISVVSVPDIFLREEAITMFSMTFPQCN